MAQVMPGATTNITVQVPDNAPPGTLVQFTAPNGQPVQVQIPPGLAPGAQFQIAVPAAPQAAAPAGPVGPVVLVDHLLVAMCCKPPGYAFAGHVSGRRPCSLVSLAATRTPAMRFDTHRSRTT